MGSKWILLILFGLLSFLQFRLWTGEGNLNDVFHLNRSIQTQATEVTRLNDRNQRLATEVQALRTSAEAFEERARAELGMIKDGETFYVVVEPMR